MWEIRDRTSTEKFDLFLTVITDAIAPMSIVTKSLVSARLPACLVTVTIDYFGQCSYCDEMAEFGQYEDCANSILESRNTQNTIFRYACQAGYLDIMRFSIPTSNAFCALDYGLAFACFGGQLEVVNLLIAHGVNAWDLGLRYACRNGHRQIAELMIAHGATRCPNAECCHSKI